MNAPERPQHDDFVDRVVTDPSRPPNVTLLQGFVGSAEDEDHVRVYADAALTTWVDVPADAVRHVQKLPPEHSPLGGSVLWVDAAAPVAPAPARERPTAGEFLRGDVQARLAPHAYERAPGGITDWIRVAKTAMCTQFFCPSPVLPPPPGSVGIACTYQLDCWTARPYDCPDTYANCPPDIAGARGSGSGPAPPRTERWGCSDWACGPTVAPGCSHFCPTLHPDCRTRAPICEPASTHTPGSCAPTIRCTFVARC